MMGVLITPLEREAVISSAIRSIIGESRKDIIGLDDISEGEDDSCSEMSAHQAPADGGLMRLCIIDPYQVPQRPRTTKKRQLTKRGVLYVGYPCNLRCVFCYYAYTTNKEWYSLEECKHDASLYRTEYGNEWVDITGGEPTIYPHIFELLGHCREIDLKPTLITNTLVLADEDKVKKFQRLMVYTISSHLSMP